ncbi:MAG: hypothetical protein EA403_14980 [Spirochaetaceae bacterium]|nr:MAG: hypothetical protein EA403_14980 [Spirochaetaceae bacterium]
MTRSVTRPILNLRQSGSVGALLTRPAPDHSPSPRWHATRRHISGTTYMRIFQCDHCGQPVYFDNGRCEGCGSLLGFLPTKLMFIAVGQRDGGWSALAQPGLAVQFCLNYTHGACNWLIEAHDTQGYCRSCRLNQTIPPLNNEQNLEAWRARKGRTRP